MEICRLCLQNTDTNERCQINVETIINTSKFLQHITPTQLKISMICEVCTVNINTINKFVKNVTSTEAKISNQVKSLKLQKINLKGFYRKENKPLGWSVCRICLKVISKPKMFLCESDTNILRHDCIKSMLKFCNITMNFELSFNPVMCMNCWEDLQVIYSFKKDYLEVHKKIKLYCQLFDIHLRGVTVETLQEVKKYFLQDFGEIPASKVKCRNRERHSLVERENPFSRRRSNRIRLELDNKDDVKITARKSFFCTEDYELIMKVYFELTKCEGKQYRGFWQVLAKRWLQVRPDRPLSAAKLSLLIKKIRQKKFLSRVCLEKIKAEVGENLNLTQQLNSTSISNSTLPDSDSDDSFADEAVHSSFTPHIKLEPLSDSDVEVCVFEPLLEPKQEVVSDEVVSDCESIPELERMDIAPLQFKIENTYSLDIKREVFNNYMAQEEDTEELRRNRKESLRHQVKNMYRCTSCSFECEARFEDVVHRHILLHQKGSIKLHYCPYCPYRIASVRLLKQHVKKHTVEDELPVLQPTGLIRIE